MESAVLLQAVAGVAHTVRSLYGPNKLRKQVTGELGQTLFSADAYTVASALQSLNAGTAILQQAVDEQRRMFGTGCTVLLNLCGVLAEAVLELRHQGLTIDIIQQALSSVEKTCLETAKLMRVPTDEAIPSFQKLAWPLQLAALGRLLSTKSIATSLAMEAAAKLDPVEFCGDESIAVDDLITTHVLLGGVTSSISSRVLEGVLLPIANSSLRQSLRCRCAPCVDATILVDGGVAVLAGDFKLADIAANASIHVIFVYGEISAQALDASASTPGAPLCIPVSSYKALRLLAEMSGAEVIDSWDELLPSAIGCERLDIKTLELSVTSAQEDDDEDDEMASFYLQVVLPYARHQTHVSIVVQGPTRSLATELRGDTRKLICRLRNVLGSGFVLPGNGGFWCACAAAVAQEAKSFSNSNHELLSFATARLADPMLELGVILLENSGGCHADATGSFFSRLAKVQMVRKRFERGVQDVGASKFFSRYYDFRSTEYAVLSPRATEPESEDDRSFHADEYKSMGSAIRGACRVLWLILNIDQHRVN